MAVFVIENLVAARRQPCGQQVTSSCRCSQPATLGNRAAAEAVLTELQERSKSGVVPAVAFALIYIGLGDPDRAFVALDAAISQCEVNLLLKADPVYDPLRIDSRFRKLLERMKLPVAAFAATAGTAEEDES